MNAPLRMCPIPGCGKLTRQRRCERHAKERRRGEVAEQAKAAKQARGGDFYSSRPWRRLRREKLSRQPLCEFCLMVGHVTVATVVDHVQPRQLRPDLAMDFGNLRSSCASCHGRYGATADRPERTPMGVGGVEKL